MPSISAIIPVANGENLPLSLLDLLKKNLSEVLVVSGPDSSAPFLKAPKQSRAVQMNYAAAKAKGDYLWFIHADSFIDQECINKLMQEIENHPEDLLYFDLKFYGGNPLMFINELGVRLRSEIFKMPFGDQAFCLPRSLFFDVGTYPEDAAYGEDHILSWLVRIKGKSCISIGATIGTSPRKYIKKGWANTTLMHLYLTYTQAYPLFKKLWKKKYC
ncbi:MAG: glycosyltransferase [Bdellovibrionales bacterium]|nr:glycosyltransferase [Bdellovibrionales bacterium]